MNPVRFGPQAVADVPRARSQKPGAPALYTLAYPALGAEDARFIERFRCEHDSRKVEVIAPHFTLLFACQAVVEPAYVRHVGTVAKRGSPVGFTCRYAKLGANHEDGTAYVFLVPEEGYSALSRLHDDLYTGIMSPHLWLDVPFTPHITIGSFEDWEAAKALCDQLNREGLDLRGTVNALTVATFQQGKVVDIANFKLGS